MPAISIKLRLPAFRNHNRRTRRVNPSQSRFSRYRTILIMLIAAMAIGSLAGLGVVYLTTPPQLTALETFRPMSNTLLYDDTGQVFGSLARERRIIAQYDDYPKVLYDAVLSIEDRDFERHSGVSVFRLFGAAYHDLVKRDSVEG